ncbi:hypothetical protein TSOC_000860 [Tetrabaena socialis]|uniref:Phosphate transporter n=1 Tax=Tetrabaena socialis TaxID=47790 RepID=A0A2J8AIB5_9CHLO|nr:hypothetical protein TSOC_000860 [Tetrabaena socialis]|eukprot:PNH12260.1 hypothetical protein TSOC_000860 [Tetrabaena socialis]
MAVWHEYTWIVVVGCLAAFFTAYGIVANAFGSSVAARTLTMRQALLIASVCEFGGSVLLGGEVTRTVASGIARLVKFEREPQMYMFGMLCALIAAGAWLILATYWELPVSTTHSTAGAVMGFALVYGGPSAVVWLEPQDQFPYMRGMVPIVISWFTGPLLSALATALLFLVVRTAILRRENSLQLAFWALPCLVFFTVFINSYFVLVKGATKKLSWPSSRCAWISAIVATGATLLTIAIAMPLARRYVYQELAARSRAGRVPPAIVLHGTNVDVHEVIRTNPRTAAIHEHAEVFDPATEHAFKYLQVVTAICDSFSHGANDVANSVGPFTAIWYIYRKQRVDYMAELPIWILVIGGAGIVVGLATYGYNIIRAIGVRFSVITPSRGFCIELSTALVVAVASIYGLPISTTHCQVGATAGMGFLEGAAGVDWRLGANFFLGWIVTLLITGGLSAALFAAGAYTPSVQEGRAILQYEDALLEMSARINSLINRTNMAARADPATWGNFSAALNASLAADLSYIALAQAPGSSRATRPIQHMEQGELLDFLNRTVETYTNNSLPYMGGMLARGQVLPRRP